MNATYSPTYWSQQWKNRPASPKAVAFARTLQAERAAGLTPEPAADVELVLSAPGNAGDVSLTIDRLKAAPRVVTVSATHTGTRPDPVTEPGFYLHDERLYKVQESRSSGRLYAKVLVVDETPDGQRSGRFEYANGAVYRLTAAQRLTAEQAGRLGHGYGFCVRCTKALDDPRSTVAGYGATCAGHEEWAYPTAREAQAVLAGHADWTPSGIVHTALVSA